MGEQKHTPGKLHRHGLRIDAYGERNGRIVHTTIAEANDFAGGLRYGHTPEEAEANADRIMLAWNSHDQLLKACEAALSGYLNWYNGEPVEMCDRLRAAIDSASAPAVTPTP